MSHNIITCECGGKTNISRTLRNIHKSSKRHQDWAAENSPKEYVLPKVKYTYTCICGTKLVASKEKNIKNHENTEKHKKLINKNEINSVG